MTRTFDSQTEENNFCDSIIIAKTVWNAILQFLLYGIARKLAVILLCKLATHNERINVKIAISQFVPNFLSYISAKYYLNWFTVGKLSYNWSDFEPIFARSASAVTPSEKVQFTLIGSPLYALSNEPKMIIVRCP